MQDNPVYKTVALFHILGGLMGLFTGGYGKYIPIGESGTTDYLIIIRLLIFLFLLISGVMLLRRNPKGFLLNKYCLWIQVIHISVLGFSFGINCLTAFHVGARETSAFTFAGNMPWEFFTQWKLQSSAYIFAPHERFFFIVNIIPLILLILLYRERTKEIRSHLLKYKIGTKPSQN